VSVEEIALTLPAEESFHGVAHLVLGGLAARLDLSFDALEDLELGLDTLLERFGDEDADVSVRVRISDDDVTLSVGPFSSTTLRGELERDSGDALGLRRILDAVSDQIEVVDEHAGEWISLRRRVQRQGRSTS
jgi:hypothetical protein